MVFVAKRQMTEIRLEQPLTYSIWLYFVVLWTLKSFSWNVEVKPSRPRKMMSRMMPWTLVPCECEGAMLPVSKNSVTPPVTQQAMAHSVTVYRFCEMSIPQHMTGIILKLFPSICTGKDTYLKASYWHQDAATFEIEMAQYFHTGAAFQKASRWATIMKYAKMTAAKRLMNTRKMDRWNISSP